jgi:hypothetical protein
MKHCCTYCNYETEKSINYDRHILTKKHKTNIEKLKIKKEDKVNTVVTLAKTLNEFKCT